MRRPDPCATPAGVSTFAVDGQAPFVRLPWRFFDQALAHLQKNLPAWILRAAAFQDLSLMGIDPRVPEKTLHAWIQRATGPSWKGKLLTSANYAQAIKMEKDTPGCGARRDVLLRLLFYLATGACGVGLQSCCLNGNFFIYICKFIIYI